MQKKGISRYFNEFFRAESSSAILLLVATLAAIVISNSSLSSACSALLSHPLFLQQHDHALSIREWINDGLMAIFFFSVGIELRNEFKGGDESWSRRSALPVIAAIGGMLVPAGIYLLINSANPASKGWGIPMATDIAFSLGVLSLLGKRIPTGLRVFVASLAIADDLGAIFVIAFFYPSGIEVPYLLLAIVIGAGLLLASRISVRYRFIVVLSLGVALWYSLLQAGIQPVLSGIVVAFALSEVECLCPWVWRVRSFAAYVIVPLFAFANAGILLTDSPFSALFSDPVPLGIIFGLVIGKTIGIYCFSYLACLFGISNLPEGVRWPQLLGASVLCGIGFTMSLFIGQLAFDPASDLYDHAKFAILAASIIAGVGGYVILRFYPQTATRVSPSQP